MPRFTEWEERVKRMAEEDLDDREYPSPRKYVHVTQLDKDTDIYRQMNVFLLHCTCDRCESNFFHDIRIPNSIVSFEPYSAVNRFVQKLDELRCEKCNARVDPDILKNARTNLRGAFVSLSVLPREMLDE